MFYDNQLVDISFRNSFHSNREIVCFPFDSALRFAYPRSREQWAAARLENCRFSPHSDANAANMQEMSFYGDCSATIRTVFMFYVSVGLFEPSLGKIDRAQVKMQAFFCRYSGRRAEESKRNARPLTWQKVAPAAADADRETAPNKLQEKQENAQAEFGSWKTSAEKMSAGRGVARKTKSAQK